MHGITYALQRNARMFRGQFNRTLTTTVRVRDRDSRAKAVEQLPNGEIVYSEPTYLLWHGIERIPARIDEVRSITAEMNYVQPLTASEFLLIVPADCFLKGDDIVEVGEGESVRYLQIRKLDDMFEHNVLNQYRCAELTDASYD